MSGETINNIIGYTSNPSNRLLSSGGSSGGEGALISLKGSPVGFGTDIGGSIRIPAIFNGLYGLRPSSGRLPYEGMANSMDGQNTILSVVGPLGTSVGALKIVTKALLKRRPWEHDPLVVEMPWRDEQEQMILDLAKGAEGKRLSFGLMRSDGLVGLHPPVNRALDMVVEVVKKLGHEIVEWKPPSHKPMLDLAVSLTIPRYSRWRTDTQQFKAWNFDGGEDCESPSQHQPIQSMSRLTRKQYEMHSLSRANHQHLKLDHSSKKPSLHSQAVKSPKSMCKNANTKKSTWNTGIALPRSQPRDDQ